MKRTSTMNGITVDQFIEENADPIWLHQIELCELMPVKELISDPASASESVTMGDETGIPF